MLMYAYVWSVCDSEELVEDDSDQGSDAEISGSDVGSGSGAGSGSDDSDNSF